MTTAKLSVLSMLAMATVAASAMMQAQEVDVLSEEIDEVVVEGIRGSVKAAMDAKRDSSRIMEAVSASDLGKLPDDNLAEALGRLPGLTVQREAGRAVSVSIRGLSPDLTSVSFNGQKMATGQVGTGNATQGDRIMNFNTVPTGIVDSVEVIKGRTADMDAGAIGGAINIKTKKPLDIGERQLSVALKNVYSEQGEYNSPEMSLNYNNVFDNFGVNLSVAYEQIEQARDMLSSQWRDRPNGHFDAAPPDGVQISWFPIAYERLMDRERLAVNLNGQLQLSDALEVYATIGATEYEDADDSTRWRVSTNQANGSPRFSGTTIDELAITGATFTNPPMRAFFVNSADSYDTLLADVGMDWVSGDWSISAKAYASTQDAERLEDDTKYGDTRHGNVTITMSTPSNFSNLSYSLPEDFDPGTLGFREIRRQHRDVSGDNSGIQLDFTRQMDDGFMESIQFGLKVRSEEITVAQYEGKVIAGDLPDGFTGPTAAEFQASTTRSDWMEDFGSVPALAIPSNSLVHEQVLSAASSMTHSSGPLIAQDGRLIEHKNHASSNNTEQTVTSAYFMVNFSDDEMAMPVSGDFGVRFEKTSTDSGGWDVPGCVRATFPWGWDPAACGGPNAMNVEKDYDDLLPNLNVKIAISDQSELRLAISKDMARPSTGDIALFSSLRASSEENAQATVYSPSNIDPYRATTYSAEFLHQFAEESFFVIGYSEIDVENFTSQVTYPGVYVGGGGVSDASNGADIRTDINDINSFGEGIPDGIPDLFDLVTKENGGSATQSAVEISLQGPMFFLPAPLNNLGYILNHSIIDSETDMYPNATTGELLSLPYTSDSVSNVTLYYQDDRFEGRISYNKKGDFVISPANRQGQPTFGYEYTDLSASIQYRVLDNLTVSLEGRNLTDEALINYLVMENLMLNTNKVGRQVVAGINYNF